MTSLPSYYLGTYSSSSYNNYLNKKLRKITISDGVSSVGDYVFANNSELEEIIIPDSITETGIAFLLGCKKLTSLVIPVGISSINNNFCHSCTGLKEITFTAHMRSIYPYSFYGCTSLTKFVLPNQTGVARLDNSNSFQNTPIASGTGYIYVPDNLVDSFKTASGWKTYANQIKGLSELPTE